MIDQVDYSLRGDILDFITPVGGGKKKTVSHYSPTRGQNLYVELAVDFPEIAKRVQDEISLLVDWKNQCNINKDPDNLVYLASPEIAKVVNRQVFFNLENLLGIGCLEKFENFYKPVYRILRPGETSDIGWRYSTYEERFVECRFGNEDRTGINGKATIASSFRGGSRLVTIMWSKVNDQVFDVKRIQFPLSTRPY